MPTSKAARPSARRRTRRSPRLSRRCASACSRWRRSTATATRTRPSTGCAGARTRTRSTSRASCGDPADPTAWHDLQGRIEALREAFQEARHDRRERRSLFNRIRYHGRRVASASEGREAVEDWQRIGESVAGLLATGLPASNVELRDLLLPWHERIPAGFEPGEALELALREIDRYLASRETEEPRERRCEPTPEVRRAAELLRGRRVVLIGGQERPRSREALELAFELAELRWISTSSATSYTSFEPEIARPETALVILAIRWSAHSFENVKEYCERYGKPYVRLPAGYGPNRVAAEILSQASGRLARA
jgi:hypothetical protein